MGRLIDADALKNSIDEHVYLVNHGFNETEYGCTQYGIHQIIDDAPTIDAVPVIRCADCKYWSTETEQTSIPNMRRCTWWRNIGTFPIDFCSRAERKLPQVNPEMVKALRDRIEKQRGKE